MKVDSWHGCYPSSWKGAIVEDAFTHPAKFSSKLIRRIYEHLVEEGFVKAGDVVVDPFGGVALGAMDAMRLGLRWRGSELESHFVELGNANIALWNERFSVMPNWSGDALLLQGDSRFLASTLLRSGSQAAVSSPPFLQSEGGTPEPKPGGTIDEALYARHAAGNGKAKGYGESEANLGNLRGSDEGFSAAVGSPPYAESVNQGAGANDSEARIERMRKAGIDVSKRENVGGPAGVARNLQAYGSTPGQLGALPTREFDAAVSSLPYADQATNGARENRVENLEKAGIDSKKWLGERRFTQGRSEGYGNSQGQLGGESGDDFWLAARAVIEQTFQVLAPGGVAVWVVKDFVKDKKRVPFCDQWRELCESVGFVTLHEHHAMLVHHKGTQHSLDGSAVEIKTSSKSFFRRLAEKNGSPPIDFEVVFCMQKPTGD